MPSKKSLFLVLAILTAAVPAAAAPDTSLKDVMKKMGGLSASGDAKGMASLFAETKGKGKPEFANWSSLADQGKAAAEKGDLDAAKATCKGCHDAYRNEYKTKYGSKAP
jgi:cytochrome c556